MENKKKKCSLKKHSESEAISYCQQCKIYLCNKCYNHHSEVLENHNLINLNKDLNNIFIDICEHENHNNKLEFYCKNHNTLCCLGCLCKIKVKGYGQHCNCDCCDINEIFIDKCKEEGHINKLEFYCKDHNTLCCLACLCKIKVKGYGQHSDCNYCYINDIKEEKKNKLRENINYLEDLSIKFEKSIDELKVLFEKIDKDKEELKLKIQKIFTQIRNSLNEKEGKLLLEVDEKFNDLVLLNRKIILNIK